jgi:hypothetical protein
MLASPSQATQMNVPTTINGANGIAPSVVMSSAPTTRTAAARRPKFGSQRGAEPCAHKRVGDRGHKKRDEDPGAVVCRRDHTKHGVDERLMTAKLADRGGDRSKTRGVHGEQRDHEQSLGRCEPSEQPFAAMPRRERAQTDDEREGEHHCAPVSPLLKCDPLVDLGPAHRVNPRASMRVSRRDAAR